MQGFSLLVWSIFLPPHFDTLHICTCRIVVCSTLSLQGPSEVRAGHICMHLTLGQVCQAFPALLNQSRLSARGKALHVMLSRQAVQQLNPRVPGPQNDEADARGAGVMPAQHL